MSFYLNLPFEAAGRASIVPFANESTFFAMAGFGGYDLGWAAILALLGAAVGHGFNWLAGQLLLKLQQRDKLKLSPDSYAKAQRLFLRYGIFLLPLSFLPLMNLLGVAAGFFNLPLRRFLPLVMLGEAFHYSGPVLRS